MTLRLALVTSLLLLLAGCAGLNRDEDVDGGGDPQRWSEHKEQVAALDGWQITGKVGIRSPKESGSGTLFWLQRQDYYDIRLSGPLGRGAARLTGRPGMVLLDSSQGRFAAASAEELLQNQLGWELPVSHLLWWIRGLPAEGSRSQVTLDTDNRLQKLEQDGWRVEYTRYGIQDGYALPERLKLYGQNLEITLVINEWQPRVLGQ